MSEHCCKVGRVTASYELDVSGKDAETVDAYLAARWTGDGEYSAIGYRRLAEWFNERLIRKVYVEHDRSFTDVRIESELSALAGGDELKREEVMDDLDRDGIDGDQLQADLVSRSTMSRHLKECLTVQKEPRSARRDTNWEMERIEFGRRKFRESVDAAVSSLTNKGDLPGGKSARIELPILLSCPECAIRVSLSTALERGYICDDHL